MVSTTSMTMYPEASGPILRGSHCLAPAHCLDEETRLLFLDFLRCPEKLYLKYIKSPNLKTFNLIIFFNIKKERGKKKKNQNTRVMEQNMPQPGSGLRLFVVGRAMASQRRLFPGPVTRCRWMRVADTTEWLIS